MGGVKHGAHLGAVNSVESLRLRCFCPEGGGCWHLRSARGRPMPTDKAHTLNVYGLGKITIGRAVWFLLKGALPKRSLVVYRTCETYDCANPEHFRCGRREAYLRRVAKRGCSRARLLALAEGRARKTKITAELRQWAAESSQPSPAVAHALDCSSGRVNAIRREMLQRPVASVFHLAAFAGARELRRAA